MTFHATIELRDETAIIRLDGDLDASTAPGFQRVADLVVSARTNRLVLDMTKLNYLSSAGLRQLVYARQKMADEVRVVLVNASERVAQTIRLVGYDQSVTFADAIPE